MNDGSLRPPLFARAGGWYGLGAGIAAASLALRALWYPLITSDYAYFIRPWFDTLARHAWLTAFAEPFADYAPLYLYLLKALSFIPVASLYSAKTLSLAGDLLIAWVAYHTLATSRIGARRDARFAAAAAFFAIPTVMVNSSLWGQSDSLYGAFVLLALLGVLSGRARLAALSFSFALALKIQAIFFLPILAGFLLRDRTRYRYFALPPAVFILSVLPAWVSGGNLWYWLFIYAKQAGEYPYLSVSAQSAFAFVEPLGLSAAWAGSLFWIGIIAALAVAGVLALFARAARVPTPALFVLLSLASVLFLPYLLPRMHERYFYLADLFAVLYAFYERDRFIVAILVVFSSLVSYLPFLSPQIGFLNTFHVDLRTPAALMLVPIGYVAFDLYRAYAREKAARRRAAFVR